MEEFRCILTSSGCLDLFEDNTPNRFRNKLVDDIELEGEWTVGLERIVYPQKIINISETDLYMEIVMYESECPTSTIETKAISLGFTVVSSDEIRSFEDMLEYDFADLSYVKLVPNKSLYSIPSKFSNSEFYERYMYENIIQSYLSRETNHSIKKRGEKLVRMKFGYSGDITELPQNVRSLLSFLEKGLITFTDTPATNTHFFTLNKEVSLYDLSPKFKAMVDNPALTNVEISNFVYTYVRPFNVEKNIEYMYDKLLLPLRGTSSITNNFSYAISDLLKKIKLPPGSRYQRYKLRLYPSFDTDDFIRVRFSKPLCKYLGYKPSWLRRPIQKTEKRNLDVFKSALIMIYSNVVEGKFVGQSLVNLLGVVPIGKSETRMVEWSPAFVEYEKLSVVELQTILIEIYDDNGNELRFSGGEVFLFLHFLKKKGK